VGELAVLLAGGWVLFARLSRLRERTIWAFATGDNGIRIARILFAVSLIPIGLSHLVYVKETANFVPAWLPFRTGWACLTGVGQIACGIGVLFSIYPRVAASGRSSHVKFVYASRLGSHDSGLPEDTATFRRTAATLLMASGSSVKTTQELMRHATADITLELYAQAITEDK